MDKDVLSVTLNLKVSKYGPPEKPPRVVVELATGQKALEVFETIAKTIGYEPAPRRRNVD